jgi:polysaccharide biosynthesis transport protein
MILGAALGAAGGYYYSKGQQPVYQASTRAMLMRAPLEQSSDLTYYSDLQLVQTYLQLLTTQPVLDKASERLGYKVNKGQVSVKQNQDTQIMELTVQDSNPRHTAEIANTLVQVLIEHNTNLQSGRYLATEESLDAQIDQVESQIKSIQSDVDKISNRSFQDQLSQTQAQIAPLQDEVSTLQQEIAALTVPKMTIEQRTEIAEKQARIDQIKPLLDLYQQIYSNLVVLGKPVDSGAEQSSRMTQLQSTLDLYQQLYLNLLSSRETIRLARLQNTPDIVQIEEAVVPGGSIRPRPLMNAALGAMIGLILAAGMVFLIEYLDDTLKTPEDVERALGVPVMGFVADLRVRRRKANDIFILRQPRSAVAEAFRSLRTNIGSSAAERPIRTLLVTSTGPSEGKTTIVANLAAAFSQSKKRVVVMDADLRRPKIHRMFGLNNTKGLSNLFVDGERIQNVSQVDPELPNLLVIPSGDPPPNPAELLASTRMSQILEQISRHVDLILIDTPPSMVADAQILAARVDAVLFVIQPGKTRANMAKAAMESFRRSGARVIGVVMNRIPRNRSSYYGGYKYYSTYGSNNHYYSSAAPKRVKQEPARSSILQTLPKTATEPALKPVQVPAIGSTSQPEPPVQKPFQAKPEHPGNNGKVHFEVAEDADDHPAVDKLFANLVALPPQNPPSNHRNNGHS